MAEDHLSTSLLYNFQKLSHVMDAIYKKAVDPLNLTIAEWHTLFMMYQQDEQRAGDLAQAIGRPTTSFTPILDGLERKGFIARRADPRDRRAVRIYLTEHAQQFRSQFDESVT